IGTSWCLPLEPSMMVTVFCSPGAACFAADFTAGSEAVGAVAGFSPGVAGGSAMRTIGSPPNGLELKIAKPAKVTRNRPSRTASACMPVKGSRNRRLARAVFCPSGALRSSAVSAMDLPGNLARIRPREDTSAGQFGGTSPQRFRARRALGPDRRAKAVSASRDWVNTRNQSPASRRVTRYLTGLAAASGLLVSQPAQQKGRSRGPPFSISGLTGGTDQLDCFAGGLLATGVLSLAALSLAALSLAALSPLAAGLGLTLTPCSRSSAIFSALSSLASGGT